MLKRKRESLDLTDGNNVYLRGNGSHGKLGIFTHGVADLFKS